MIKISVILICLAVMESIAKDSRVPDSLSRQTRAVFPSSSTMGVLFAVAIPLDLPNRDVFYSYNFEANYNLPWLGSQIIPGPFGRIGFEFESEPTADDESEARNTKNHGNSTETRTKSRRKHKKKKKNKTKSKTKGTNKTKREIADPLITRKFVYRMLEDKLRHSGYKGKPCLLRTICEVNAVDLGHNNGVLGDLLHVVFKPTSSEDEHISDDYYEAEFNGLLDNCQMYHDKCPNSVLELITEEEFYFS